MSDQKQETLTILDDIPPNVHTLMSRYPILASTWGQSVLPSELMERKS